LDSAGQAGGGGKGLAARHVQTAGRPQSHAEAAAIVDDFAQGLKGMNIPYGNDACAALLSVAKGLGGAHVQAMNIARI
jgi:hypothetical protein